MYFSTLNLIKNCLKIRASNHFLYIKVLMEKDPNVLDNKLKAKAKPKAVMETIAYESSFMLSDDSVIEDDDANDPDWRKTPLYTRIHKLEVYLLFQFTLLLL